MAHNLYNIAQEQNIEVLHYPLPQTGSMSVMLDDGTCYIGMDATVLDDGPQESVHLAHELGHCITGSFYNRYAAIDHRRRHENRADKWAVEELIPQDELDDAIASGYTELWDLADHFGVTEAFILKAICWYVHGNMAADLYF